MALALYFSTIGYYPGLASDMARIGLFIFDREKSTSKPLVLVYSGKDYALVYSAALFDAMFFFQKNIPYAHLAGTRLPDWGLREGFPARFREGRWFFRLPLDPQDPHVALAIARFGCFGSHKTFSFTEKIHTYLINFAASREPAVHVEIEVQAANCES